MLRGAPCITVVKKMGADGEESSSSGVAAKLLSINYQPFVLFQLHAAPAGVSEMELQRLRAADRVWAFCTAGRATQHVLDEDIAIPASRWRQSLFGITERTRQKEHHPVGNAVCASR